MRYEWEGRLPNSESSHRLLEKLKAKIPRSFCGLGRILPVLGEALNQGQSGLRALCLCPLCLLSTWSNMQRVQSWGGRGMGRIPCLLPPLSLSQQGVVSCKNSQ